MNNEERIEKGGLGGGSYKVQVLWELCKVDEMLIFA
jgi:hypothetical protein